MIIILLNRHQTKLICAIDDKKILRNLSVLGGLTETGNDKKAPRTAET
jgi:hypothetical protein